MSDFIKLIREKSFGIIILIILAFFLKVYLEKRIEGVAGKVEEIGKISLDIKKDLRGKEQQELVSFRVALETWEYFLQSMVFDFSMLDPLEAKIGPLYEKDKQLFLEVKIAAVKVSTYLRDRDLETKLLVSINKIRNTYYPIIYDTLPRLMDIQTQLIPIDTKINHYFLSGMKDSFFAPTEEDKKTHQKLQTMMTNEVNSFTDRFLSEYKGIAEQMADLKESINHYIYRPVTQTDINQQ